MKIILLLVSLAIGGARLADIFRMKKIPIEQAPHFISLRQNGKHVCGGALVSRQHILTAAHCVWDKLSGYRHDTRVISGLLKTRRIGSGRSISNISVHEDYLEGAYWCDIAVVRLSSPVSWTIKRNWIALPNADAPYGKRATLTALIHLATELSNVTLRELSVRINRYDAIPINGNDYAPAFYGTLGNSQTLPIGAIGGPLVYKRTIIGIAWKKPDKHRRGCYFINVVKFKTFIKDSMERNPVTTQQRPPSVLSAPDVGVFNFATST